MRAPLLSTDAVTRMASGEPEDDGPPEEIEQRVRLLHHCPYLSTANSEARVSFLSRLSFHPKP